MASPNTILLENREYWTQRAPSYSLINRRELATPQHCKWRDCLQKEIAARFPDRAAADIRVLEVGTGPGFFAILLAECGYDVTAIDLTPAMLAEARQNAGELCSRIRFLEGNAEDTGFPGGSFDVIVSRNLTWNLPHPEQAYAEWARLLAPGGLLLNFDANWYCYLYDEQARAGYERDRQNTAQQGMEDANMGSNFRVMEDIARRIPLSSVHRPAWDVEVLQKLGLTVRADAEIWQRVWTEQDKVNFASTPLFLVSAVR